MAWPFGNGVNTARFSARLALAEQELADEKLTIRLQRFAEEATRQELAHINLVILAKAWQRPLRDVVRAFLIATKHKLFTLHFLLHCEGCNGGAALEGLHSVKSKLVCPACKHENKPTLDHTVEIAFCIENGMSNLKFDPTPANGQYLHAIDVVNTEEFKLLFERDKPLPGEHITVGSLTFLFTDLSGSTATYERLGDGGAYRIVREHFTLLFDIIKKHNGTVIKTIGDAVMATFTNPADAVRASIDAKEAFVVFNKRRDIRGSASIKVGIHTGPCLAVTLNSRLDYFGTTVNKAARVQSLAEKDQICITQETLSYPEAVPLVEDRKLLYKQVPVKGIKEPVQVSIIK